MMLHDDLLQYCVERWACVEQCKYSQRDWYLIFHQRGDIEEQDGLGLLCPAWEVDYVDTHAVAVAPVDRG